MKYRELMAELRKGTLQHVYLLAGEEPYFIEKAEQKILQQLFPGGGAEAQEGLQKLSGDVPLETLLALLESAPFFADKNVVIVRDTVLFHENKNGENKEKEKKNKPAERLLQVLTDMPPYSYVIFESAHKADKRRKIYKTVMTAGSVLESEAIRAWNISDWLTGKLQEIHKELDRDAYVYFTGAVSMMQTISLGFLDREFEKLALYTKERRLTKADLRHVFASIPEVSLFAMLDAVSERQIQKALQLFQRQAADGVYLPLILSLLVRHVRQLWQAKVFEAKGLHGRQLAVPLGLNPFIAEKIARYSRGFSEDVLEKAFLELTDADYALKTGQGGPELLENVLIHLCGKRTSA